MEPIIQSLGFKAKTELEDFITDKLQGIKYDKIIKTEVTLFLGPDSDPANKVCEIRLHIPGNDLFAKRNAEFFEPAVNECIDVLQREVKQLREKQIDRRQADATAIQDALMSGGVEEND
ncbi:HPF/RaiA family ribosome-associated protein [uncultured Chitinophaga sp.]|uniref:HPF/RaiA family ribosome-associated protein n=1 Tax=uncultured Chitinophaga sp. TaxID=339340 RepID=UPI0025E34CF2|nr:HPF/RaiA family ribosome-associated protein [uncultured Chitinophaga sp.]